MIEIKNLDFSYGDRQVLHALNLKVETGSLFGLLGPNGGGKSTLFRLLSTLVKPKKGTVLIDSIDLAESPADVRNRLGVVFQHPSLDKKLTARENLIYQGHLYGVSGKTLKDIVETRLREFNLMDRAGDRVETLSGGMQRRLEIAKSLLHKPKLLLLDEPSTGLDPGARRDLWNLLKDLKKAGGLTILFTTHILEEAEPCDEVAILHKGKLVAQGSPDSLKKEILENSIYVKTPNAKAIAQKISEQFKSEIEEIHLNTPSLDDVFFQRTGEAYEATE